MNVDLNKQISLDNNYELSALLDAGSLYYMLMDDDHRAVRYGYSQLADFPLARIEKLNNVQITREQIILMNSPFVIVPDGEYTNAYGRSLLEHSCGSIENRVLRNDHCADSGCRVVYAISTEELTSIQRDFQNPHVSHIARELIDFFNQYSRDQVINLVLLRNRFIISVVKEGIPVMVNSYQPMDEENLSYFLALTMRQCGMETSTQAISAYGFVADMDKYPMLTKCFNIRIGEVSDSQPAAISLLSNLDRCVL